jgi:GTP cyclohydrolase I
METVGTNAQALGRSLTWGECYQAAGQLWHRIRDLNVKYLYGIPRGGCMAALLVQSLAHRDGVELVILDAPTEKETVIVDDLVDSGRTLTPYAERAVFNGQGVEALYRKPHSPTYLAKDALEVDGWITFPWEQSGSEGTGAEDCIIRLLQFIGEDPGRNGLLETPKRVLKAWKELTAGYGQDYKAILNKSFDQAHDELVLLRGVEFHSTCEHHMLPFYGTAAVGYIPSKSVVGISKLARLVDCFARRLQIQERMTNQIAAAIQEVLAPVGVGVVLRAKHACMGCRGVGKPDADMVTSVMLGALREDRAARAEFLSLVNL